MESPRKRRQSFCRVRSDLDCIEYNTSAETVTWENCSLRQWLNTKFIDNAFTTQEQDAVLESLVVNQDGAKGSEAGADTYDKVYLLSIYEVIDPELGFPTDWKDKGGTRVSLNTGYTKSKGAITGADMSASVSGSKTILNDGALKLKYTGAVTGANEYISILIEDADGNILYYGNIVDNSSSDATDSGNATLNIPSDLTPGNYVIKVFSEQCNGNYKTDLASNIVTLDITVSKYKTADRNLCIGIGAAIVAAACVVVVIAVRKKNQKDS